LGRERKARSRSTNIPNSSVIDFMRNKTWLHIAIGLILIYVGYILWAKFAKVIGQPPIKLSETGEFWLFFSAIFAFTIQVFVEDEQNTTAKSDVAPDSERQA
jgi:hypothetical protein